MVDNVKRTIVLFGSTSTLGWDPTCERMESMLAEIGAVTVRAGCYWPKDVKRSQAVREQGVLLPLDEEKIDMADGILVCEDAAWSKRYTRAAIHRAMAAGKTVWYTNSRFIRIKADIQLEESICELDYDRMCFLQKHGYASMYEAMVRFYGVRDMAAQLDSPEALLEGIEYLLSKMTERERTVILSHLRDMKESTTIAEELGIPEMDVASLISSAMAFMSKFGNELFLTYGYTKGMEQYRAYTAHLREGLTRFASHDLVHLHLPVNILAILHKYGLNTIPKIQAWLDGTDKSVTVMGIGKKKMETIRAAIQRYVDSGLQDDPRKLPLYFIGGNQDIWNKLQGSGIETIEDIIPAYLDGRLEHQYKLTLTELRCVEVCIRPWLPE